MKANELRIGVLIKYYGSTPCHKYNGEEIILSGNEMFYECFDPDKCEPIPLTEEWLLKFGFVQFRIKWKLNDFSIVNYGHIFGYDLLNNKGVNFKYVHQLQNLYFALTGEELTLKQTA